MLFLRRDLVFTYRACAQSRFVPDITKLVCWWRTFVVDEVCGGCIIYCISLANAAHHTRVWGTNGPRNLESMYMIHDDRLSPGKAVMCSEVHGWLSHKLTTLLLHQTHLSSHTQTRSRFRASHHHFAIHSVDFMFRLIGTFPIYDQTKHLSFLINALIEKIRFSSVSFSTSFCMSFNESSVIPSIIIRDLSNPICSTEYLCSNFEVRTKPSRSIVG